MPYTINVVLNGWHYFATDPHSIPTIDKCLEVFIDFKKRFPASDGYSFIVNYSSGKETAIKLTGKETLGEIIASIEGLYKK